MELNKSLAELTGVVIGDGNIWTDGKSCRVDINGDPKFDTKYFDFLSRIIEREFDGKTRFQVRPHELVLRTNSKRVFDFLTKELGLPYGAGKGKKVTIPTRILFSNWSVLSCCIRGIADTDGSLFFAKKKGYRDDYPSIEISTTSEALAEDLKKILESKAFRVGFRKQVREKWGWSTRYIISLYGEKMLEKWMKEIGFSNPRRIQKFCTWKKPNKAKHQKLRRCGGNSAIWGGESLQTEMGVRVKPGPKVSDLTEPAHEGQN